jgi:ADP-ribose pyrophosphatase YjhB (NUDIX family)
MDARNACYSNEARNQSRAFGGFQVRSFQAVLICEETALFWMQNSAREYGYLCIYGTLVRQARNNNLMVRILCSIDDRCTIHTYTGGRLLKGETFFAAATRKAVQETGLTNVKPIQVLGVWNTFFPTSHWDNDAKRGTQTVNPIVLVELLDKNATIKLDDTSENYRWIGLDPDVAEANGEDRYVLQALRRLQAWNPNYNK